MLGLDLKSGDKIAVTPNSGGYSTTAALEIGLVPILVDIELRTHQLDIASFKQTFSAHPDLKCVVVTHCGPVSPGSGGMALHNYVTQGMMNAGFVTPTQGKVIIPSYQSEWSYALCTKDTQIAYWMIKDLPLELGLKVLDRDALQSFFLVPSYYTTLQ
jgi:hypothetical protein